MSLTIEEIRKRFKLSECVLSLTDDELRNAFHRGNNSCNVLLPYRCCKCNFSGFITVNNLSYRKRCPQCNRRWTYKTAKQEFEKIGYKLLQKYYKNAHQSMPFICDKGHSHRISLTSLLIGKRCMRCYEASRQSPRIWTYGAVKEEFDKIGYTLLEDNVTNARKQRLSFICHNGHKHEMTFSSFLRKKDFGITICRTCSGRPSRKKWTYNTVRKEFEKLSYTLLEDNYKGYKQSLRFICDNGKQHCITFNNFFKHKKLREKYGMCAACHNVIIKTKTLDEFIKQAKLMYGDKFDYSMVDYLHSRKPIIIICPTHGQFTQTPSNHLAGSCLQCYIDEKEGWSDWNEHSSWKKILTLGLTLGLTVVL